MKITEFRAGTGRTVTIMSKTLTGVELEISGLGTRTKLGLGDVETLREFFQADRDEELGRWRDPENPDYVVYATPDDDGDVRVLNERNGVTSGYYSRQGVTIKNYTKFDEVAYNYFAAHPKPKPWYSPNHLEIWALTIQGCPSEAYIYRGAFARRKAAFRPVNREERVEIEPTDPKIADAKRIWPES